MKSLKIIAIVLLSIALLHAQDQQFTIHNNVGYVTTVPTNCTNGMNYDGTSFTCAGASGGLPSGMIAYISTGTCPSGWTELAHSADYVLLTVAANGDVGTTGGSTSYTPAGTNTAATFTGNSGTVPAETFTGTPFSSVINHTHTVTVTYNVQGGTSASTSGTHVMTSAATGGSARAPTSGDVVSATTANPSGGVSSITPAGTNGTASFTPAGTNSAATFSGTPATIQPTYLKLIGCSKN